MKVWKKIGHVRGGRGTRTHGRGVISGEGASAPNTRVLGTIVQELLAVPRELPRLLERLLCREGPLVPEAPKHRKHR